MSLSDVSHQGHAQRMILRAISGDRLPHAYLFHGPDGVGKELAALGLAELLLCPSPIERVLDPADADRIGVDRLRTGCGRCDDCVSVATGMHPDLHLIYRQLNRDHPDSQVRQRKALDIGVDVLRHFVIGPVGHRPIRGLAKVFVVREADRITVPAQNSLLKTLEEPPGPTVIILLVTSLDRLLPTTLSRCQALRFQSLPTSLIKEKLTLLLPSLSGEMVDWYARSCEGRLGVALQRARDGWYERNRRLVRGLAAMTAAAGGRGRSAEDHPDPVKAWMEESKDLAGGFRQRDPDITETEAGRRGLKAIFQLAAHWYADVLRYATGEGVAVVNAADTALLKAAAAVLPPRRTIGAVTRLAVAEHQLDLNANVQLCVETLVNDLPRGEC